MPRRLVKKSIFVYVRDHQSLGIPSQDAALKIEKIKRPHDPDGTNQTGESDSKKCIVEAQSSTGKQADRDASCESEESDDKKCTDGELSAIS